MAKIGSLNLWKSKKTVFTFKDIFLLTGETKVALLRRKLSYYVKTGELYPLRRGLYARSLDYDRYELATKIFTPSYVSFETVLGAAGIIFQFYGQIFVASYQSREIICAGQKYAFKKVKDTLLTNSAGLENRDNYTIASPERAFLDTLYLYKDYHFDNLALLNWDKVREILPIYGGNKRMAKMVDRYQEDVKKNLEK